MPDITRKTISATEAPALVDASPYITRWMLYRRLATGMNIDSPEHNRMDWGKRMEPLILTAAAEELRLEVVPNAGADGRQVYERRNLLGCTRDATVICPDRGPGAFDAKCVFDYRVWMDEWAGGKKPPRHHEIQLQVQMYVGDGERPFQWGTLCAWLAGDLHFFDRKPIPELWERLEKEAAAMFADIAAGREPDPFGAPVEQPWLAECFPTIAGKVLDLSDASDANAIAIAERVRLLVWHADERLGHERAEKAVKAELLGLAKDCDTVLLPYGIKVSVSRSTRAGFTVKPTTVTKLTPYVPKEGVPIGDIKAGEVAI